MSPRSSEKLYSTEQIRDLECCIITTGISGFELMTRAGQAAFELLRERWLNARVITVFCGAGNNAGDGYIVARLLLVAGLQVEVYTLVDPALLKRDALKAYQSFIDVQGKVQAYDSSIDINADVFVDAMLGTGLSREVSGSYAAAIASVNGHAKPVLSLDVPSGINADTGAMMGAAIRADCTITFIGLKKGLFTADAPEYCGEVVLADLRLSEALREPMPTQIARVVYKPMPKRSRIAHKGDNGHVLVIGGACGYSGAALLAGQAALMVGSGLVSLATRPEHAHCLNLQCPELMCHAIDRAENLQALLDKASVVVIGPGLGQSTWAQALLALALGVDKPLVIDADALNLLAKFGVPSGSHANWILTPHPGEAARLLGTTSAIVQQDRFTVAQALQVNYGGIVVLKGVGTLIAGADEIAISSTGNPGMAAGGMGDVLTGVIAGLCAQGLSNWDAAQQGAYIHGAAADDAAQTLGERGLLASTLLPYLRGWVNK